MWCKIQILLLYCIASEVLMAERLDSRRNVSQGLYSIEDSGSAKWNRIKRSLSHGSSCRIRGCCTGRDDDCSFTIVSRGAICYCDQYCTSGSPGPVDCCADYWDVCNHPVEPPRSEEPWPPPAWGTQRENAQLELVHCSENTRRSGITDQSLECINPENATKDMVDKDIKYDTE